MSRVYPVTRAYKAAVARWKRNQRAITLNVDVFASARVSAAVKRRLQERLRAAHQIVRPALRNLSLALVGDTRMSAMHEQYLGIAGPTDVLTFPLERGFRNRVVAGEVVVCVAEAARQARCRGIPLERELLLYALHGMLHLCGYDDKTPREFRRIHRTEDMILTQLGIGPVFDKTRNVAGKGARR